MSDFSEVFNGKTATEIDNTSDIAETVIKTQAGTPIRITLREKANPFAHKAKRKS